MNDWVRRELDWWREWLEHANQDSLWPHEKLIGGVACTVTREEFYAQEQTA